MEFTRNSVARILGVSANTVTRLVETNKLRATNVGTAGRQMLRFELRDVEAYLRDASTDPGPIMESPAPGQAHAETALERELNRTLRG